MVKCTFAKFRRSSRPVSYWEYARRFRFCTNSSSRTSKTRIAARFKRCSSAISISKKWSSTSTWIRNSSTISTHHPIAISCCPFCWMPSFNRCSVVSTPILGKWLRKVCRGSPKFPAFSRWTFNFRAHSGTSWKPRWSPCLNCVFEWCRCCVKTTTSKRPPFGLWLRYFLMSTEVFRNVFL